LPEPRVESTRAEGAFVWKFVLNFGLQIEINKSHLEAGKCFLLLAKPWETYFPPSLRIEEASWGQFTHGCCLTLPRCWAAFYAILSMDTHHS
jgi:hypothetical protein